MRLAQRSLHGKQALNGREFDSDVSSPVDEAPALARCSCDAAAGLRAAAKSPSGAAVRLFSVRRFAFSKPFCIDIKSADHPAYARSLLMSFFGCLRVQTIKHTILNVVQRRNLLFGSLTFSIISPRDSNSGVPRYRNNMLEKFDTTIL